MTSAADQASEMIGRFLRSPRAKQLAQAGALHREVEFMLAWPPGETNGNGRYLRGFIDLLYQDAAGHWHLVDYKTNQVVAANVSAVSRQYELQLAMYALAAERILGKPPVDLVLYFLQPGVDHSITWNDDVRHDAIEILNQAIAAATDRSVQ